MPIKIPDHLPAVDVLHRENIVVMTQGRAITQDIRPLQILLVNLMPKKIQTEVQFSRLLGKYLIELILYLNNSVGVNFDVRRLSLHSAERLMYHNFAVGKRKAFAFRSRREQKRAHACRHTHADRGYVAFDIIHSVVYRHSRRYGAAGAVYIKRYILIGILRFKIEELRYHERRRGVVYFVSQKYYSVVQKS